ncbi:hypothetical protein M8C21_004434, partial [Ambrosia artemisiifolia]
MVKVLERDHALAQKRWIEACQVTNQKMMRLEEQIQALRNENSKLQEAAEGHQKVLAEKDSVVAGLRSDLNAKDQELVSASTQLSELVEEKEAWVKEKAALTVERASLEESLTVSQTEAENAKTLLDEATVAQQKAQDSVRWVMTQGIAGIFKRLWNEPNLGDQVAAIAGAARAAGEAEGFETGFYHALNQGRITEGAH